MRPERTAENLATFKYRLGKVLGAGVLTSWRQQAYLGVYMDSFTLHNVESHDLWR
jgi:hypothetical protein